MRRWSICTALLTFVGWMIATGDAHRAITIAIAVLIITCPCALGLAVPMVQVVAARRLFERGIMVKDGGGAGAARRGRHRRLRQDRHADASASRSSSQGRRDRPVDLAIAAAIAVSLAPSLFPGAGRGLRRGRVCVARAGSRHRASGSGPRSAASARPSIGWDAPNGRSPGAAPESAAVASVVLSKDGRSIAAFDFEDQLRPDAREAVEALARGGLPVEILSGDREAPVRTARGGARHSARGPRVAGRQGRAYRSSLGNRPQGL